jgi:lipopolysaccharide biosynthesis glycosyltransferase
MNIAFNINQLGLQGLGATLTSLIRNCSDTKEIIFWFLCSELEGKDKDNIRQLLLNERFAGDTNFIDFDARKTFGKLKSLHADWTAYGRLLIPGIVTSGSAVCLDSGLIILADVLKLGHFFSEKHPVGSLWQHSSGH